MNVRRQIFRAGIEPRPFSTFVPAGEYVFRDRKLLIVVDDGLTIKCIAVFIRVGNRVSVMHEKRAKKMCSTYCPTCTL